MRRLAIVYLPFIAAVTYVRTKSKPKKRKAARSAAFLFLGFMSLGDKYMTKIITSYDRIYEIVRQIPRGYVATYGQIAELANLARKARVVGYALYRVDMQALDVPWQRVVNAKGEISLSPLRFGTDYLQRSLLEAEGIIFSPTGKIDLRKYLWKPDLG